MERIKYLLFILFIIVLPNNVLAFTFSCDKSSITIEDELNCTVYSDDNSRIPDFEGYTQIDSYLECSIDESNSIKLDSLEKNYFVMTGTPSNKKVLTYKCKLNSPVTNSVESSITINYTYEDLNENLKKGSLSSSIKLNPTTVSTGNKSKLFLKSLTLDHGDINFSKYTNIYELEVDYKVENIKIDAYPENENTKIDFIGDTNLKVGENTITIRVSNDDNEINDYILKIKRLNENEVVYSIDDDSSLGSLIISNHALKFNKDVFDYELELASDENSINLIAKAYGPNATVTTSSTDKLKNGSKIYINVLSYSGKNKSTYTITIKKVDIKINYTKYIIIGVSVLLIILILYILRKLRLKRIAKDPILRLKNQKRLVNKGMTLDTSNIPDSTPPSGPINLNDNQEKTIVIQTEKQEDTNLNKITDNRTVLDLNNAKIVSNNNEKTQTKTPSFIVSDDEEIEIIDE